MAICEKTGVKLEADNSLKLFPWPTGRIQKITAVLWQIFQIYIKAIKRRTVMLDQGDVKIGLFPNFLPSC